MTTDDVAHIVTFLESTGIAKHPPELFSFHGGEPFAYVKIMDAIMSKISSSVSGDYKFFIQTNGSMITRNRWFFEKWGARLAVSISYDFLYQDINRTAFSVEPAIELMKECGVPDLQFQYVMPIQDPRVFSLAAVKSITSLCFKHSVNHINLIPLRHIRGKDKFRVIVDEIDLPQFFSAFLKFIQILYVMGIDVVIDGHSDGIDKHYFENHKQLVLSPDGYIYPEYDFLEYKHTDTTIGTWKGDITVNRDTGDNTRVYSRCSTCVSYEDCGLKYLHKAFEVEPGNNCTQFYQMLNVIIKHTQKLKQKHNILEWVGV